MQRILPEEIIDYNLSLISRLLVLDKSNTERKSKIEIISALTSERRAIPQFTCRRTQW